LKSNAMRTLERACGTLAIATLARRRGTMHLESAAQHEQVARLAAESRAAWRALVVDDREFQDFFRSVTPIDVIDRMQIGSRSIWEVAAADPGGRTVRSTPWVFAWSQARFFLPGWYGSGTALQAALAAGQLQPLRDTYGSWRFFGSVLDEMESQLARTDLEIADHYVQLVSRLWRRPADPRRVPALPRRGAGHQGFHRVAGHGPDPATRDPAAQSLC
jgi:phosphoenolpyruvate carboxylase